MADGSVNIQVLLEAAAGERIGRQADSSTAFLQELDRKFLQVYTETDPVQSAAIRQIQHREAPIEKSE